MFSLRKVFKITLNFNDYYYYCVLVILATFVTSVSPGANDLHFYDGTTAAEYASDVFFEIIEPEELSYTYRVKPAKDFGAPFNESLQLKNVHLVPTDPLHSCSTIINHEEIVGHIALSERGLCSFVFKTAMAQGAGARAIIITESIDEWEEALDNVIEMVDDQKQTDVNIPSAFLLGRSGAMILRTLDELSRRYAVVNLPVNLTYVPIGRMNQPPWITW